MIMQELFSSKFKNNSSTMLVYHEHFRISKRQTPGYKFKKHKTPVPNTKYIITKEFSVVVYKYTHLNFTNFLDILDPQMATISKITNQFETKLYPHSRHTTKNYSTTFDKKITVTYDI